MTLDVADKTTRRRWTREEKKAIVAETKRASVLGVARKYDIAPRLLFLWRQELSQSA